MDIKCTTEAGDGREFSYTTEIGLNPLDELRRLAAKRDAASSMVPWRWFRYGVAVGMRDPFAEDLALEMDGECPPLANDATPETPLMSDAARLLLHQYPAETPSDGRGD